MIDVFKLRKKTALPVMQQAKIENSERDESRVDAKKCGGAGGGWGCFKHMIFEDFKLYNLIRIISFCYL